jgi:cytochrome P450/NADPH-cytochrome P450 reductase
MGVVRVLAVPSRVPGKPKAYVQDRILEQRADVWRLIEADAMIFVCGNANTMAPAVRSAFMAVFRKQTGKSQADADVWLAALRAEHRYLEDIWGGSSAPIDPAASHDAGTVDRSAAAVQGENT